MPDARPPKLIAIDLDGTLLRPGGKISPAVRQAVQRALDAGVHVIPATGRGWREATIALHGLDDVFDRLDLGVFNTGACVADVSTGESVCLADFEPTLALELVDAMRAMPEAVLVYMDRSKTGIDYLVTGDGDLTENTQRWLSQNDMRFRENRHPSPEDLRHALRVGMVAVGDRAFHVAERVQNDFQDRVSIHAFAGVPTADDEAKVYIAEIFAAGVDKWRGVSWVASELGIDRADVAAMGDEINDIALLREAGLGIAMGNAVDPLKQVADVVLDQTNEQDGVAHAIDRLLAGEPVTAG